MSLNIFLLISDFNCTSLALNQTSNRIGSAIILILFKSNAFTFPKELLNWLSHCIGDIHSRNRHKIYHVQTYWFWTSCQGISSLYAIITLLKRYTCHIPGTWETTKRCEQVLVSRCRFWLVYPLAGFAGPRATADQRSALRIDAQRRQWILNWRRFKPRGNLAPINLDFRRLPGRQVALARCLSDSDSCLNLTRNPDFSEFSKLSSVTQV